MTSRSKDSFQKYLGATIRARKNGSYEMCPKCGCRLEVNRGDKLCTNIHCDYLIFAPHKEKQIEDL